MDETTFNPLDLIGKKLGQHYLEEIVGQTTKSVVYRGKHLVLGRQDALKVLKPGQSKERQEQFLREGERVAVLEEHPNIANVYDAGEDQGFNYIAMKLVRGENLQDLKDAGKIFPIPETVKILKGVSTADAYAHSKGLKHEDIKLANIKMKDEGPETTYLVDFGGRLTDRGPGPPKDDVIAIGMIARQLLENKNPDEIVPRQLDHIIYNAEKKNYQNPDELKEALESYEKEIEDYKKRIKRREFLKKAGITIGAIAFASELSRRGIKHHQYRSSIDFIVDKLEETDETDIESIEPLLKKLEFRLINQKIRKLPQEENFREERNGLKKLYYPYDISTGINQWNHNDGTCWSDGFWEAILWSSFQSTQDHQFKELALEWARGMRFSEKDHDYINTIRFYYSHALGYDITGDERLKETALDASEYMDQRYNQHGGIIQTGGRVSDLNIQRNYIDAMTTGLPLLAWEYRQTRDDSLLSKIRTHCDTTIKYNVNEDGSTIQVVKFNSLTGESEGVKSHGYNATSCLSRGQARAIKGFVLAHEVTKDRKYLNQARKCADYYIEHLSADKVPLYDFKDPNKGIPKDSSAAAIGASGLLDLARVTKDSRYKLAAIQILRSLSIDYLSLEREYQGMLLHGCANKNRGSGVDASLIYGDYHFLEALSKI